MRTKKLQNIIIKLVFLLGILIPTRSLAQVTPSSCIGPDSLLQKYTTSAYYMARDYEAVKNNSSNIDSIIIPQATKNMFLDAIMAVYNTSGIERDSVFIYKDIRCFINSDMYSLIIDCDTSAEWGKQLSAGNLTTGYVKMDSMLLYYHFDTLLWSSVWMDTRTVCLQTDSAFNMIALATSFRKLPDVLLAGPNTRRGDGNNIFDSIGANTIDLAFVEGLGRDCDLSWCNVHKYWRFRIYPDCGVEYLGHIPLAHYQTLDIVNNMVNMDETLLFPNPANASIQLRTAEIYNEFFINDVSGRLVKNGLVKSKEFALDISDLSSGIYYIKLLANGISRNIRFIKE